MQHAKINSERLAALSKFGDRYNSALKKLDAPEYQQSGNVARAQEYINENRKILCKNQTPDQVSSYLEESGRKKHLNHYKKRGVGNG